MQKYDICPICRKSVKFQINKKYKSTICQNCGHGFLNQQKHQNQSFESSGYLDWRIENSDDMISRAKCRVGFFLKSSNFSPKNVLEIGCSTGEVLAVFCKTGANCFGVDLSEKSINYASREYPEINFEIAAKPSIKKRYDTVMAFHVMEHIKNIGSFFFDIRSYLRNGGYVYLAVPNFNSLSRKVLGSYWPDFMPEHVQYFTPKSLSILLKNNGIEIIAIKTNGSVWQWLGGIKRIVASISAKKTFSGRPPKKKFMLILRVADRIFRPLLYIEELFGVGSELVVIGKMR